jgi:outer membrane protein, heavy metal efflux system
MKSIYYLLAGLTMATHFLTAQDARLLDESLLTELRAEASRRHPAALSAQLRSTAAEADTRSIRLWEDPMVGLSLMAAEREMRRSDGDVRLSFEQPLPRPSLYQATRAKAEAIRRATLENSRSASLLVGVTTAKDAIELALADESTTLLRDQLRWFAAMTENARQRSISPDSNSIDALRLESELARARQVLAASQRTRERISQSLNLQLGRPMESAWPRLQLGEKPSPFPLASAEIARIARTNPQVRSLREMATAASAETQITQRERLPQFSVSVDTNLYSGGGIPTVAVGLKMSLPYFNRSSTQAAIQAAQLREKAAATDIESSRLTIADAILTATTDAANAAAQADAYSGEIYQHALAAAEAVENSWISSKSSLSDLLDARRQLFSIRLEQRRYLAMQLAALEELNLLVPHSP